MKAVVFDGDLKLADDYPRPALKPGWAVIQVIQAGICRTDLELISGYLNFKGVLGHEFVGRVVECEDSSWIGQRVVGEINAACGHCEVCRQGMARHCPHRSVLGILNLDGCLAEYCMLPVANLHAVPEAISNDEAVFMEPLSAAFEIMEQVPLSGTERCLVLGDGKLGILCAWALATVAREVTLIGHHEPKLALARWGKVHASLAVSPQHFGADLVVEATGSAAGFQQAMSLCRPRGVLVLKSTIAAPEPMNLAPLVINEIQVLGSRCGPFARGLAELAKHRFPVNRLIAAKYPLTHALRAFACALQKGSLKVLVAAS